MSHRNARTFVGRLLIVQRHRAGWPQAHIASAMGISRKCVKTWLARCVAAGAREPGAGPRIVTGNASADAGVRGWLVGHFAPP
ncbi:leucine zipper domain-containing protein [Amycolatopsis sp. NPDC005232]|uniref:helix-turn-helix domain-containing protein n=1 Tax=Amycolatopsis sp. NPDC005232 TaxID=3157027 RepID=UPI0033B7CCC6